LRFKGAPRLPDLAPGATVRLRGSALAALLANVWFAVVVAVVLLVAGSAYFASTMDTPSRWVGALVNGLAVGASGVYVGTTARRRNRRRSPR